jgi:Ni/Co efflux regulator RcnB
MSIIDLQGDEWMKKIAAAIMALSVIATPLAATAQELFDGPRHFERDRDHRHRPDRHNDRHSDRDLMIGGIVGLTTGLFVGSVVVDEPRYDRRMPPPPPRYYGPRGPRYFDDGPRFARAWSPAWYRWCSQAHRSFDPRTGTFIGRDGRERFCEVR